MRTDSERPGGEQHNMSGSAGIIITGGAFSGSNVTAVSGSGNSAVVMNVGDAHQALMGELTRIGHLLQASLTSGQAPVENQNLERVRAEVARLRDELAAPDRAQLDQASLRKRLSALIAGLAPVAEIIGGVAALQAILQHL